MQLTFLIGENTLLPMDKPGGPLLAVTTPPDHKLLINLVLAPPHAKLQTITVPPECGSPVLYHLQGRDDSMVVCADIQQFTDQDRLLMDDIRSQLRAKFTSDPKDGLVAAEAMQLMPSPDGNVVAIVPCGREIFN